MMRILSEKYMDIAVVGVLLMREVAVRVGVG